MMLPPDDSEQKVVNVPRGICPECGSGEVMHLLIGMLLMEECATSQQDWVRVVGCVHPGYNRECASCGATWTCSVSRETFE